MNVLKRVAVIWSFLFAISACASTENGYGHAAPYSGEISKTQLLNEYSTFENGVHAYQLSEQDKEVVSSWPSNISFEIYFGTWCHDSEREVPRLIKILSNNQNVAMKLYALDYQKKEPSGKANKAQVKYTPTIVVLKNGVEVGRIVERPAKDLVSDIDRLINR